MAYPYTGIFFSTKSEVLIYVIIWMNHGNIISKKAILYNKRLICK